MIKVKTNLLLLERFIHAPPSTNDFYPGQSYENF